jgi:DNA-directed RNA polymerase subunit H (RpoH/RPB5)
MEQVVAYYNAGKTEKKTLIRIVQVRKQDLPNIKRQR